MRRSLSWLLAAPLACSSSSAPASAEAGADAYAGDAVVNDATNVDASTSDMTDVSDGGPHDSPWPTYAYSPTSEGCDRTIFYRDARGAADGMLVELVPVSSAARCEDVSKAYCTPGTAPCRVSGSGWPVVAPENALHQFQDFGPSGMSEYPGTLEGGNEVITLPSRGMKMLVCETLQLAGGSVPAAEADRCLHDASYTSPSVGGGWCVTNDPALIGPTCTGLGSVQALRLFDMLGRQLYFVPPRPKPDAG